MYVRIPWKGGSFPLRADQHGRVEQDAKGLFLRVRNPATGRDNKCRVSVAPKGAKSPSPARPSRPTSPLHPSPSAPSASAPTLDSLVGGTVSGVVTRTGPHFVALLVDRVDGLAGSRAALGKKLVSLARDSARRKGLGWKVATPRSWDIPLGAGREVGPHVSLHAKHLADVGRRVSLRVVDTMHWEENSRWVALELRGPLADHTGWTLHLSCAQEPL
jgi:hypothetical protein